MSAIAAYEGAKRLPSGAVRYAAGLVWIAIFAGTFINTFIVTEVILKIDPWWNPRYLIPLAGMIMGNALNSGSLAGERFIADFKNRLAEVETMLTLGYSSKDASADIRRKAVRSALIPTLNSMFTVGLVHLPGMMTGQILGGASPLVATKYQIVVMFMISSTVVVTALVMLRLLVRRIFTPAHQIRYDIFQDVAPTSNTKK
jgi:putative ABC transport system permease protein